MATGAHFREFASWSAHKKIGRASLWARPCVVALCYWLGFDAHSILSPQDFLAHYYLVRRAAARMDKRRGVYRNTVVGCFNSGLAGSAVRNPTCGLFVEFLCGLFQLGLRERTLLHEDLPPCVCCQCHISTMLIHCHYGFWLDDT